MKGRHQIQLVKTPKILFLIEKELRRRKEKFYHYKHSINIFKILIVLLEKEISDSQIFLEVKDLVEAN